MAAPAPSNGRVPPDLLSLVEAAAASLAADGLLALGVALFASNAAQWEAEDRSRSAGDDARRGAVKVEIDELNRRRTTIINQIDDAVRGWAGIEGDVPVNTEGLGQLVDRFTILLLRRAHFVECGNDEELAACDFQVKQLDRAARHLFREVSRGCRRLPLVRVVKSYAVLEGQ